MTFTGRFMAAKNRRLLAYVRSKNNSVYRNFPQLNLTNRITRFPEGTYLVKKISSEEEGKQCRKISDSDSEKPSGDPCKNKIQTEIWAKIIDKLNFNRIANSTKSLLLVFFKRLGESIVAQSLFILAHELRSKVSAALQNLRSNSRKSEEDEKKYESVDQPTETGIGAEKASMDSSIQDTDIGTTKEELVGSLGITAFLASKKVFKRLKRNGVGINSSLKLTDKVDVYIDSLKSNSPALKWTSNEGVIKKCSAFVGRATYSKGQTETQSEPVWFLDPKEVTQEQHNEFYRSIGNTLDTPRFYLHYKTEYPLSIRALIYFPAGKQGLFDLLKDSDVGVALYTRTILIQSKTDNLLPKWLRFVKGVVDSEDVPPNLSRELLQNSALIKELRNVLTNHVLTFLEDCAQKEPSEYKTFYEDYGLFLKEGIVTSEDDTEKEAIAKLLRFDSSKCKGEERTSLSEYCNRADGNQKDIYYLPAPTRTLAELSPYYVELKKKNVEVLFCYEPYDELALLQLGTFLGKNLVCLNVSKETKFGKDTDNLSDLGEDSLSKTQDGDLVRRIREQLVKQVSNLKATSRLDFHPYLTKVKEMVAARSFLRTEGHQMSKENLFALHYSQLETILKHPVFEKLRQLSSDHPELTKLIVKVVVELFLKAMVGVYFVDDPRTFLTSMNELLIKVLENIKP